MPRYLTWASGRMVDLVDAQGSREVRTGQDGHRLEVRVESTNSTAVAVLVHACILAARQATKRFASEELTTISGRYGFSPFEPAFQRAAGIFRMN